MEGVYDAGGAVALEGEWTGTNSGPLATPNGEVTTGMGWPGAGAPNCG